MAKKLKKIAFQGKVELVGNLTHHASGPRGIDVYTRELSTQLSRTLPHDSLILSKGESSKKNVNLIHYTFFDPFFLTLFGKTTRSTPYVVTVHDLIPLHFPEHFYPGIRGRIKYLLQKKALQGSSAIITDSQASKRDIAKFISYPLAKIYAIPLATNSVLAPQKLCQTVKAEYHLPDRFLLYVGDINWNKNVTGLIQAFARLKDQSIQLILVGKAFTASQDIPEIVGLNNLIAESGVSGRIRRLGFIPSHHLRAIYRLADLYVQPSWYEGFGFPVLEAMVQQTPVLSSNQGSLQEVGGEHVHYFDPTKNGDLRQKLNTLLANDQLRNKYTHSGSTWASNFSWEKVAQETIAVYEKYAR